MTENTTPKPRPRPTPSRWSAPFWEAAARGELVLQKCGGCGELHMYPKVICPRCFSGEMTWVRSSGTGEIYTVTEQQAGPPSGFESMVPYVLIVVRLDEGVQLMSNLVGESAAAAECGDRVVVDFERLDDEVTLPVFRLAPGKV